MGTAPANAINPFAILNHDRRSGARPFDNEAAKDQYVADRPHRRGALAMAMIR